MAAFADTAFDTDAFDVNAFDFDSVPSIFDPPVTGALAFDEIDFTATLILAYASVTVATFDLEPH